MIREIVKREWNYYEVLMLIQTVFFYSFTRRTLTKNKVKLLKLFLTIHQQADQGPYGMQMLADLE